MVGVGNFFVQLRITKQQSGDASEGIAGRNDIIMGAVKRRGVCRGWAQWEVEQLAGREIIGFIAQGGAVVLKN